MSSPASIFWKRFSQKKLSVLAGLFILAAVVLSVLGYVITPDHTPLANEMSLALALKKPGFSVRILHMRKNRPVEDQSVFQTMLFGRESAHTGIPIESYMLDKGVIQVQEYTGLSVSGKKLSRSLSLAGVLYGADSTVSVSNDKVTFRNLEGVLLTKSYAELQQEVKDNISTKTFLLGSDKYGRDMLSRLMIGTRITLSVGLIAVLISLFIGIGMGALAGFYRSWVDDLVMWFINVIWSIPTLLLVVAITLALGKGFWQVFVAVGLTMWVEVARVVRGQIFSLREMEYVEAARALGFSNFRTITRHILPNIIGPVIVISASNFASAILLEAGLSFLGVGAQPPTPSWGIMIRENYPFIIMNLAYLAMLPGIAIMLMVLAFNLVGNGLRDAFDTKDVSVTV